MGFGTYTVIGRGGLDRRHGAYLFLLFLRALRLCFFPGGPPETPTAWWHRRTSSSVLTMIQAYGSPTLTMRPRKVREIHSLPAGSLGPSLDISFAPHLPATHRTDRSREVFTLGELSGALP
jgi:hypothetical protein